MHVQELHGLKVRQKIVRRIVCSHTDDLVVYFHNGPLGPGTLKPAVAPDIFGRESSLRGLLDVPLTFLSVETKREGGPNSQSAEEIHVDLELAGQRLSAQDVFVVNCREAHLEAHPLSLSAQEDRIDAGERLRLCADHGKIRSFITQDRAVDRFSFKRGHGQPARHHVEGDLRLNVTQVLRHGDHGPPRHETSRGASSSRTTH